MTVTLGVRTIVQRESAETGVATAHTAAHAQTMRVILRATRSMKHLALRGSFSPIGRRAAENFGARRPW
jgi:hypothetical protein